MKDKRTALSHCSPAGRPLQGDACAPAQGFARSLALRIVDQKHLEALLGVLDAAVDRQPGRAELLAQEGARPLQDDLQVDAGKDRAHGFVEEPVPRLVSRTVWGHTGNPTIFRFRCQPNIVPGCLQQRRRGAFLLKSLRLDGGKIIAQILLEPGDP